MPVVLRICDFLNSHSDFSLETNSITILTKFLDFKCDTELDSFGNR